MTKDSSTAAPKVLRSWSSWVKACTVCTALRVSLAWALVSAILSWLLRLRLLTQRPNRISGTITSATAPSTRADSLGLVTNIIAKPPINVTALRAATEAEEPITVWISVVSAVSRDSTSPVRVTSKKDGVKRDDVVEHRLAHIGDDALAGPGHEIVAHRRGHAHDARDRQERQKILRDAGGLRGAETVIDQAAPGQRQDQRRRGGDQHRHDGGQDRPAIGPEERQQPAQRGQGAGFGPCRRRHIAVVRRIPRPIAPYLACLFANDPPI